MKLFLYLPLAMAGFLGAISSEPGHPIALAEICDNALDDDGDGLIDLNDPDCDCPKLVPVSLIPNPSFEEMDCCPYDRSRLDCATGWIQASEATTDYLHTCGWMGWDDLPPPLPFPDGNGCVGWRNGRSGGMMGQGPLPEWKEYAGACLTGSLKAGTSYRFEFYVGFTKAINSPPTTIDFFGTPDCVNLPFGIGNNEFGCPTNDPNWMHLGSVAINGVNEWKLKEITVIPTVNINAIAIGPNCVAVPSDISYYYFFDNLVLAESKEFDFKITATGHPCSGNITLSLPYRDTLQYQWYKDGIALLGETGAQLEDITGEGDYQVRLLGAYTCRVTPAYPYRIPVFYTEQQSEICFGDAFRFGNENLTKTGVYHDTLKTANQCDSIIRMDLQVQGEKKDTVYVKIFESERWKIGNSSFSKPGNYDMVLNSYLGCDSLVHLVLDYYKVFIPSAFSPNEDGVNDVFTVFSGDDVKEVLNLQIFDRWGGKVYEITGLHANEFQKGWDGTRKGKPADPGVYVYQLKVVFQDGKEREITGSMMLVR